jgi:trimeric autotransporter adhesin
MIDPVACPLGGFRSSSLRSTLRSTLTLVTLALAESRSRVSRTLRVALVALLVSTTFAACGRSSLRTLHGAETGAAGSGSAGMSGAAGTAAAGRDGGVTDGPVTGTAGASIDGGPGGTGPSMDGSVDSNKKVIALAVTPSLLTLAVGGSGNFTATLTYSDGTTSNATTSAVWTSGDRTVATVIAGRVTGLSGGKIVVTATSNGFAASGTVIVLSSITLASINLDPPQVTLPVNGAVRFRVIGTFTDGSTADVSSMATWSTDGLGFVKLDQTGQAFGAATGTEAVRAIIGALATKALVTVTSATVTRITVQPPFGTTGVGTTTRFTASATLSDGTSADVTSAATWAVGDATIASVDADGLVTGKTQGATFVSATFGGQSGAAKLSVTGATLKLLQIDPVDPTVGVGVNLTFTATGLYSDGTKVDLTSQVMWQSSAPSVLPIDGTGHAVSKSVGTSVVTATMGNFTAESTVTVTPASLVSLAIVPLSSTLSVGNTEQLQALGTFSDGSVVDVTSSVTWTSLSVGVSVSNAAGSAGVATAISVGSAVVGASSGLQQAKATVNVTAATLQSITITPALTVVPIGALAALTAQGSFSDGTTRDVTGEVAWASADDSTATVANAPAQPGTVTGVKAGTVVVTATESGVVGAAKVTVVAAMLAEIDVAPADATTTAGLRSSYAATGVYSDGTKVDVTTQVTWSTDNATVATISNVAGAAGQLLARATGVANVTATLSGVTGQTTVTVTGATASSLSISPISAQTPLGTAVQYTATLVLSNGTTRNVTGQATWTSSNTSAATIGRTGRATPVAVGPTTITVDYMGLEATTTLTVTDALAVSIQVTPIASTTPVGGVVQFTATELLSDGTTRNVTNNATWVSSAPGVLGVNTARQRGRGTAVAAGTTVVTATYMGLAGDTTATVTDAVVSSISVSPAGAVLPVGTRRQFSAQAIFSDGTSQGITGVATWTSDTPSVAAVSTAGATRGQVTAIGAGSADIIVTYRGVMGSVPVTVTSATLMTIQVTPFTPTLTLDTSLQFVATAIYSDGTNTNVTATSTWSSSSPAVAGVSNAGGTRGQVTSLMKGTTMIQAAFMGMTGSTLLSVTDATITQIQVTPFSPTIPGGFSEQLAATAIYSDGTNRNVTALATWTSTVTSVAQVSDALATKGLVSAAQAGGAMIEAQLQGVTGQAGVTVSSAKLASISVGPATPTITVGQIEGFTATGTFDDASHLDITTFVTWTSSDTSVADVSNADGTRGQATAFGSGTATIQAQRGALTATATLTVP